MGKEALHPQKTVVMLTPDRQIDRRILLQADSLDAAGWSVTIIAMPLDITTQDDPRVVRVGQNDNHAKRENAVLHIYRWVRNYLPMNSRLMRWLKQFAWRYVVDQELFYTQLFFNTASQYQSDVIVAHDLPMLPVAKQLATQWGAKLVYDSHELYSEQEFSQWEKQRWAAIEARHIVACDAVITVNQSIASELESRYGINDVHVIYNAERTLGVPIKTRYFHQLFGLGAEKKVLLLQGGLSARRNLEVLVTSMAHVQNPAVVLVILGEGLLLHSLQVQASSLKIQDRVYFHPAVPQNDLLAYTVAADAGIIPYQAICLNNYFCTPNKLFEFIAAGLPIVATDLPEIRKIVEGQQIGLVGDTRTPEQLALLIDQFFADEQRLMTWQHNLIKVRQLICWEEEAKKFIKIYEEL